MQKTLHLYNTASRSKEAFVPSSSTVSMYCCGPTVYGPAHMGNLRTYMWEDVLKRTLLALGYSVKHVMNITDVGHLTSDEDTGEDKMEKGARREGLSAWDIAKRYTQRFVEDTKTLAMLPPDIMPRATEHIAEMIALVGVLRDKGFAYQTSDGIYFDTQKFPEYGSFARIDIESLQAGARIDMGEKKSVTDFALWKFADPAVKRQMEWDSPFGRGFPGWHIECSAMSVTYLNQPIDIHCGGQEHVKVHHTNEIAQTEAATGKPFVRYWVHGEWLLFGNSKMSKSEGGVVLLSDILEKGISPLACRLFYFSAHHRMPLSFSEESLHAAVQSLKRLKALIAAETIIDNGVVDENLVDSACNPFFDALCDDLNIPKAMGCLWDMLRDSSIDKRVRVHAVRRIDSVLALDLLTPVQSIITKDLALACGITVVFAGGAPESDVLVQEIVKIVEDRSAAKKNKDFAAADALRNAVGVLGYSLKDLPQSRVEISTLV